MTTASASVTHPSWCSADDCLIGEPGGRVHMSRPARAESARTGLTMTVQLTQSRRIDGYPESDTPHVLFIGRDPDGGPDHPSEDIVFPLEGELARTVGRMLIGAARELSPC